MACGTGTTFLVLILLDRQQNKKKKKKRILKMGFSPPSSFYLPLYRFFILFWMESFLFFLYFSPRHPSQHYKLLPPPFVLTIPLWC
jgi:hypothetical protein